MASVVRLRPAWNRSSHRALAGLPPLVTEAETARAAPAPLSQSGSGAQPHWPHWEKTSWRRQDPSSCCGRGGAWFWIQNMLIGWEEAWAGVLSRGRHRAISVLYCVIWVKVGRERRASECFSSSTFCNWEQYWVGGQSEELDWQTRSFSSRSLQSNGGKDDKNRWLNQSCFVFPLK